MASDPSNPSSRNNEARAKDPIPVLRKRRRLARRLKSIGDINVFRKITIGDASP